MIERLKITLKPILVIHILEGITCVLRKRPQRVIQIDKNALILHRYSKKACLETKHASFYYHLCNQTSFLNVPG